MFDLLCSENISTTEYPVVKDSTIDAEQMLKEIPVPSAVGTSRSPASMAALLYSTLLHT